MNLNITDPAFLFPGISLLFLAYTNRYLTLAQVIRSLNTLTDEQFSTNRQKQIASLHLRVQLIKYMQAAGVVAFLFCIMSMASLVFNKQQLGELMFILSLISMVISLVLSLIEVLISGQSLKIELDRTR